MWIGVGRIVLDFYNNTNIKKKRTELDALCADLRKLYNLSILEVADLQDTEKCVIGFAAVMPEAWKERSARTFVARICKTIDETSFARVTVEDCEMYFHGPAK